MGHVTRCPVFLSPSCQVVLVVEILARLIVAVTKGPRDAGYLEMLQVSNGAEAHLEWQSRTSPPVPVHVPTVPAVLPASPKLCHLCLGSVLRWTARTDTPGVEVTSFDKLGH